MSEAKKNEIRSRWQNETAFKKFFLEKIEKVDEDTAFNEVVFKKGKATDENELEQRYQDFLLSLQGEGKLNFANLVFILSTSNSLNEVKDRINNLV